MVNKIHLIKRNGWWYAYRFRADIGRYPAITQSRNLLRCASNAIMFVVRNPDRT